MADIQINGFRVQNKIDTSANWEAVKDTFVGLAGELLIESDTAKVKYGDGTSTWANLPYSAMSISEVNKLIAGVDNRVYNIDAVAEQDHVTTIQAYLSTAGVTPIEGDIAIVTGSVLNATSNKTITVQYPYSFDGENWKEMLTNVDSSRVVFSNDFLLAGNYTSIGNIKKSSTSSTLNLNTTGMTVSDLFLKMFTEEIAGTLKTNTSHGISLVNSAGNDLSSEYEVGTQLDIYYKGTFNTGAYTFGPTPTGVSVTNFKWSASGTGISGNSISYSDEDADLNTVTSIANGVILEGTFTINGNVTHSAGNPALSNTGNPGSYVIPAGSRTASDSIKTYQNIYCGYVTDTSLDSAKIRALSQKVKLTTSAQTFTTLDACTAAKAIVVAAPATKKSKISAVMPSSSNADVSGEFVKQTSTVAVAGNSASALSHNYDIWIYQPDKMDGTYSITIS